MLRTLMYVLALFFCSGYGRRVQRDSRLTSVASSGELIGVSKRLRTLARFLLAFNQAAGWKALIHSSKLLRREPSVGFEGPIGAALAPQLSRNETKQVKLRMAALEKLESESNEVRSVEKLLTLATSRQVQGAYSWSVERLRTSKGAALDAYSWSLQVASNASAAVSAIVGGFQFPALLPRWFKRVVSRKISKDAQNVSGLKGTDDMLVKTFVSANSEGMFVIALSVAWLFESLGLISLAILAVCLTVQPIIPRFIMFFLGCEAAFYVLCSVLSLKSNLNPSASGPAPFSSLQPKRRRELWRRILRDPSQSPRDFVEGWMYRKAEVAQYSPPRLLLAWAAQKVGLRAKPAVRKWAVGPTGNLLTEAFGVPWEEVSIGDVYSWLCRSLYSKQRPSDLTQAEDLELCELVEELEQEAGAKLDRRPGGSQLSDGKGLRTAKVGTQYFSTSPGIASMTGPMDPLRWRHRPLLYYFLAQGLYGSCFAPKVMREHGFTRRKTGRLSYWHRPGSDSDSTRSLDAFVFIHGIGFGVAPYVTRVTQMAGPDVDILMIELPAASQRILARMTPTSDEFGELCMAALDDLGLQRFIVAGHSLGSAYASYIAHYDTRTGGRRVGGRVLIDPIATNLHHSRTTREVIYTRLNTAQASFEDFFFKKELWITMALQRNLPWYEASFWLEDCAPLTPTLIVVGSADTIVNAAAVRQTFGSWQARLRGVRVLTMDDRGHGEWIVSEEAGSQLVASVEALRNEVASIRAAEAAVALAAEAPSKVAADVTSKASDRLAAAKEPLTGALGPELTPLATTYEEALGDAEQARQLFEENSARAAAEAERSFQEFERDFTEFSGEPKEALVEPKVQGRLRRIRVALEQDFTRAAAEVTTEAQQPTEDQASGGDSGEFARLANAATDEAQRAARPNRDLADAASKAAAKAEESLSSFKGELTDTREAAAVGVSRVERARVALVREAANTIKRVRSGLAKQERKGEAGSKKSESD